MIKLDIDQASLQGDTVNSVSLNHYSGIVTKSFRSGNGIHRLASDRLVAEITSLQRIPIAPTFVGSSDSQVHMKMLSGENHLDAIVDHEPEQVRAQIYQTAGKSLSTIHQHFRQKATGDVVAGHLVTANKNLQAIASKLCLKDIPTLDAINYLQGNLSRSTQEVAKIGLTWTHGDFWLNNLIGQIRDKKFSLTGVIDWELAKVDTPYADFAIVQMSLEVPHPDSSKHFWHGYGQHPDKKTKNYFSVMKLFEWIAADPEGNLDSEFYQPKIDFLREEIRK